MKKLMTAVMMIILSMSAIFCFAGCSIIESILGQETSEEEAFDRSPYVGTYYFSSFTYENLEYGETIVHRVGEEEYPKDCITLEIKENSYKYINRGTYIMGEWEKASTLEDTFYFYNSNDVLSFSATIKDGIFTRVEKDTTLLNTKEIYTYVLVKE